MQNRLSKDSPAAFAKPYPMKRTWTVLLLVFLTLVSYSALAWGGGGGSSSSRVRKKSPPPRRTFKAPPVPAQPPEQKHVVSSVSYHVQFKSIDGWYPIADPREDDREWLCKPTYAPDVKKVSDTKYEVFGNFEAKSEGIDETVPVVIHFTLKGKDESWKVKKRKLHSVNGTEL